MKTLRSSIWLGWLDRTGWRRLWQSRLWQSRLWQSLLLTTLLYPASPVSAVAQTQANPSFGPPFKKIVVNFAPYLDTGEDASGASHPPLAGQVTFAVSGDKLFVTIVESGQAVSPYWLQVNLETGELLKVEQIAEAPAQLVGRTTADRLSLLITTPSGEALTAQISINEASLAKNSVAKSSVTPAMSQIRLAFLHERTLIARDESSLATRRDSWRNHLFLPGQARGPNYSRGLCGWLRVGKSWIFVFPAGAPGVNTNLYVFPDARPTAPSPAIAHADSPPPPRQTPPVTQRQEDKAEALRAAKTIFVRSQSDFFVREAMERELLKRPEFRQWGMTVTRQEESADLIIEVHRKRFTTRFTFSVLDPRSGRIVASDTASSIGGTIEPKLAIRFINQVKAARQ